MADVFKLLGADIYEVQQVDTAVVTKQVPALAAGDQLPKLRLMSNMLNASKDLNELLDNTLTALQMACAIEHVMILKLDECGKNSSPLPAEAAHPGVGSEIPMGTGSLAWPLGEQTPIRISHMTSEYIYGKAVRASAEAPACTISWKPRSLCLAYQKAAASWPCPLWRAHSSTAFFT